MGCSSSREVTANDRDVPPQIRQTPPTLTSRTAINPPQALIQSSATSLEPSGPSTPRRRLSHQVSLADHYNQPLQLPEPWTSKSRAWTKPQLQRERYEFFETRVTGRPEIWNALRQVTESLRERDLSTAQGILDAVGVTLPTGKLQGGAYDEAGNLYRVPEVIISDPTNTREGDGDEQTVIGTAESKEKVIELDNAKDATDEKGKATIEKDAVKVRCRLSDRGGPDVIVMLGKAQSVGVLMQQVKDDAELPSEAKVRIAYLGHILEEKQPLTDQGWKEGHVVNALVSGVYS